METLAEYLKSHPFQGPFKPHIYYQEDGDLIHIWLEDERAYTEVMMEDNSVHIHKSMVDDRVVGMTIWGVTDLIKIARQET